MIAPLPAPDIPEGFTARWEPPGVEEYAAMRREAGLSPITLAQARRAIPGTWAWVTLRADDDTLAAMGRVIGDGSWYFLLADVATAPDLQRRGLGRFVVASLVRRIEEHADPHPYITLVGDPPGQRLYRSLGFREVGPSVGMVRFSPPEDGAVRSAPHAD